MVVRKKIKSLDEPKKHLINGHTGISLREGGILGLLPVAIMGEINDSLCSVVDKYTLTRSVPELYNSIGRGGIAALKQEADLERHET